MDWLTWENLEDFPVESCGKTLLVSHNSSRHPILGGVVTWCQGTRGNTEEHWVIWAHDTQLQQRKPCRWVGFPSHQVDWRSRNLDETWWNQSNTLNRESDNLWISMAFYGYMFPPKFPDFVHPPKSPPQIQPISTNPRHRNRRAPPCTSGTGRARSQRGCRGRRRGSSKKLRKRVAPIPSNTPEGWAVVEKLYKQHQITSNNKDTVYIYI